MGKRMRRGLIWWYLTEKRLFKKPGYLLVLLMVPVLAWAMGRQAGQEAGMVTIGLCCEEQGGLSEEILERMISEESILRYLRFDTEQEAVQAVKNGSVSAAWIFPERLEEKLAKMAEKGRITPVIRVVEREDDISLVFCREVLCSQVYPSLAYLTYEGFVDSKLGADGNVELTEEMFRDFYQSVQVGDDLFVPVYLEGTADSGEHYLTAPLRGLLSIWLVVSGMAAVLYYKRDEDLGVLDFVPAGRRIKYAFGLQAVVLGNGGIVFLMACGALEILENWRQELVSLLLLLGCIACFCVLLGVLIPKIEGIGLLIPILVILMVVLCPVFLQIRLPWGIQGVLPPYYYLHALYAPGYRRHMLIYFLIGAFACLSVNWIYHKRS